MTPEDPQENDESQPGKAFSAPHGPLNVIISEGEFVKPLGDSAVPFFALLSVALADRRNFNNQFYFNLLNEAEKLEVFLDDHGAKENITWYYFREIIASIRNCAIAAFQLSHILNRYGDYHPAEPAQYSAEFLSQGADAMAHLNNFVAVLGNEAVAELKKLGCEVCMTTPGIPDYKDIGSVAKLPRNLQMENFKTSERMIMHIAESYRRIAVKVNREHFGKKTPPAEFANMIPTRINETKIKILESSLHNIQSEYDTHIRMTGNATNDADLLGLRAFISAPMHLLEMARWLIHFYERHESESYSGVGRGNVAHLVDKNLVLGLVSGFALFFAHRFMMMGKRQAEQIMSRMVRMTRITVPVPKPAGFHARPAYYVTIVVEEHGTDAFLIVDGRKFDARSVLDILEAGGIAADKELETVEFEGDERTLTDLKILSDSNFCENEQIPKELNYIRIARNIMV
ncbi:MAG: hypothetical protein HY280_00810 [Nitrospinae bacterium]|nr:hypothetical protein [Nitrospinota bacterium]